MIVWLASYPRSGNTFVRMLLREYFGLETYSVYNDELDIGDSQVLSNTVGHRSYEGGWDAFYKTASSSEEITPIKTHDAPTDDAKAIFIVRDPAAVMVSLFYYLQNFGRFEFSMEDVILGATAFGPWSRHLAAWSPSQRPNTLFLKYEEITAAPEVAVDQIATFLGLEKSDGALPAFSELQKAHPKFFRTGSDARNKSELSDGQRALLQFMCGSEMSSLGYDAGPVVEPGYVVSALNAHAETVFKNKREIASEPEQVEKILRLNQSLHTAPPESWQKEFDQIKNVIWRLEGKHDASDQSQRDAQIVINDLQRKLKRNEDDNEQLKKILWRAESKLENFETKVNEAHRERVKELSDQIHGMRNQISGVRAKLDVERETSRTLSMQNQTLGRRIVDLENILSPRMKSILSLRPLRYIWGERNRLKKGGADIRLNPESLKPVAAAKGGKTPALKPADMVASAKLAADERHIDKVDGGVDDLGVALFAHDRADCVVHVLEALARQNGLANVHVWIDGDQGRPQKRAEVDFLYECVKTYPVKAIHKNRGNFGFRKMMLLSMKHMMKEYDRILFLEDDCFPTRRALRDVSGALDAIEKRDDIFSVYGHPFLVPGEEEGLFRFQGWGWATTRAKLEPLWKELADCYWMTEKEYLDFVERNLTPEMEETIDVTPPRQPTSTLKKFFAWDETLGLLAAMRGQKNLRTEERIIYNFGAGGKSSHFTKVEHFRKPPFNMVSAAEIWDYY